MDYGQLLKVSIRTINIWQIKNIIFYNYEESSEFNWLLTIIEVLIKEIWWHRAVFIVWLIYLVAFKSFNIYCFLSTERLIKAESIIHYILILNCGKGNISPFKISGSWINKIFQKLKSLQKIWDLSLLSPRALRLNRFTRAQSVFLKKI